MLGGVRGDTGRKLQPSVLSFPGHSALQEQSCLHAANLLVSVVEDAATLLVLNNKLPGCWTSVFGMGGAILPFALGTKLLLLNLYSELLSQVSTIQAKLGMILFSKIKRSASHEGCTCTRMPCLATPEFCPSLQCVEKGQIVVCLSSSAPSSFVHSFLFVCVRLSLPMRRPPWKGASNLTDSRRIW